MTKNIRNFCIIAHIDHGKSTLADRFLEITNTIPLSKMHSQFLDQNPISRERGITIKLAPVKMNYQNYTLNLIDTPGHVDFSYEVSRTLKAVEGAILLVDAVSGIQAQTLSHLQKAQDQNLTIIPVINKIDLPSAQIDLITKSLQDLGFAKSEIHLISAKTGQNVQKLLDDIISKISPPNSDSRKPFRAFIFDSLYHPHLGAIAFIKILDGSIDFDPQSPPQLNLLATKAQASVKQIGYLTPSLTPAQTLSAGQIGYIATGLKDLSKVRVGDTITKKGQKNISPVPGFKIPNPVVYMGLYPIDNKDFPTLKESLEKLSLNDSSLTFNPETISYLGPGFRCGFLGLLHAEITKERLENEYNLELIYTSPQVDYLIELTDRKINIANPDKIPENYLSISQPMIKLNIITPTNYLGSIMTLLVSKNLDLLETANLNDKVRLVYKAPLTLLLGNFYNQLKSITSGFASLDWQFADYQKFNAQLLNILINNQKIESLSYLFDQSQVEKYAKILIDKLKETVPRQNFELKIQAAVGSKIIASTRISPFRKDVTAKLYGGDRTRKDKLLNAQKKGKKRLKQIGKIQIPQEAFLAVSKI